MLEKSIPGTKKAATLLLSLGVERSSRILKHLSEPEVERVMVELSNPGRIDQELRRRTLEEAFSYSHDGGESISGGLEYTRQLLAQALGPHRGSELLDKLSAHKQISSFDMLKNADPLQIANTLSEEHPQTIALVLAHLDEQLAANIISTLDHDVQVDITLRLAQMDRVSPNVIQTIEEHLKQKLSGVINEADFRATGGVSFLTGMLNQVDRGVQKAIFEELEESHPKLVQEIRDNLFTFDDLLVLDDRAVMRVLGEVDKQELALALKGAPENLKDLIFRNMSERARNTLKEDLELLGPQLAKNVYEAQRSIVEIVRRLEEEEEIMIAGMGSDEEIIQ